MPGSPRIHVGWQGLHRRDSAQWGGRQEADILQVNLLFRNCSGSCPWALLKCSPWVMQGDVFSPWFEYYWHESSDPYSCCCRIYGLLRGGFGKNGCVCQVCPTERECAPLPSITFLSHPSLPLEPLPFPTQTLTLAFRDASFYGCSCGWVNSPVLPVLSLTASLRPNNKLPILLDDIIQEHWSCG